MKVIVTGGTGFIGRWLVKKLLDEGHNVTILDNLSNSSKKNIEEFLENKNLEEVIIGDVRDSLLINEVFKKNFQICYHLAANINVQNSIDNPEDTFNNDTIATFKILELCKRYNTKIVFMSTCMVYDKSDNVGIDEEHKIKPASPYAGSKIAAENLVLSYWYSYNLPVVVVRPFNTFGPYQKSNSEGGVVSIFINNKIEGKISHIYGDGLQTRDLLYVEDCANFLYKVGISDKANGEIINAGTGKDISIKELAQLIVEDTDKIIHVEHIHPQSEIKKLLCNYNRAKKLLEWEPLVSLEEGIKLTESWIKQNKEHIVNMTN